MQDGQDDLDLSHTERSEFGQPEEVFEWLDAAIRATVVAQHGFHNAPPTAAEEDAWPEARDLDDVVANDEGPAPFTPARLSPSSCIFMNLQMAGYGCASGAAGCTQAYYRRLVVPAPHEPMAGQANETEKNISPHTRKQPLRALRVRV